MNTICRALIQSMRLPLAIGHENLLTILLRGHDPASGGARNPHVLEYVPVPPRRPPPADDLSPQIVSRFREKKDSYCEAMIRRRAVLEILMVSRPLRFLRSRRHQLMASQ